MFEVKCRMPKGGNGRLAGFWLYGDVEVDVFEFNGNSPSQFSSTVQPVGSMNNGCATYHTKLLPGDLTEGYHIYTLVWMPTAISYFFDGREIRTDRPPRQVPFGCDWRRMQVCLDAEVWYNPDDINAQSFSVDYVRVYKPTNGSYVTTPYKRGTAVNNIDCLNWNTTTIDKDQSACYSFRSVPTRDFAVTAANDVFYKNDTGNLLQMNWNASAGRWDYQHLNATVTNVSANVACSPNGSNVYYSDANGRMFNLWNAPNWRSDCLDWSVANVSNNVVVSNTTSNVYYRNKNNGLSNFWYDKGWRNAPIWEAPDVSACEGSVAVTDNYIFFKTNSGQLKYITWTGSGFTTAYAIPGATNVQSSINVKANNVAQGISGLKIYYIGDGGVLCNTYIENGQWVVKPIWEASNAGAYLCLTGDQLYYRGNEGKLWNAYWYENGWRVTPINYASCPEVKGGLCAGNDGRVFFTNNRYLYNTWPSASKLEAVPCNNGHSNPISNRLGGIGVASLADTYSVNYASVTAYDQYGLLIKVLKVPNGGNEQDIRDSLRLSPGLYILRFANQQGEIVHTVKTVITN